MTDAPAPICFIDTETDGLHPGRRMWEYAIIRRDFVPSADGTAYDVTETVHHRFVSIDMRHSDPFGISVGGFWDRHPAGRKMSGKAPNPGDVGEVVQGKHDAARDIMRATFGAHLVGVNPAFDAETFAGLLRSEGYLPSWDYHLEDLVAETAGYCRAMASVLVETGAPYAEAAALPWKSDKLAAAIGVEPLAEHERHTALGDARWAKRWHDTLTATVETRPAVLIAGGGAA